MVFLKSKIVLLHPTTPIKKEGGVVFTVYRVADVP